MGFYTINSAVDPPLTLRLSVWILQWTSELCCIW